jgi:APA family basic amino acid/polyamine antiporter
VAAFTLRGPQRRRVRPLTAVGAAGCVALALTLPPASVLTGAAVLAAGVGVRTLARKFRRS